MMIYTYRVVVTGPEGPDQATSMEYSIFADTNDNRGKLLADHLNDCLNKLLRYTLLRARTLTVYELGLLKEAAPASSKEKTYFLVPKFIDSTSARYKSTNATSFTNYIRFFYPPVTECALAQASSRVDVPAA